jgi:hypothetical protein
MLYLKAYGYLYKRIEDGRNANGDNEVYGRWLKKVYQMPKKTHYSVY